MKPNTQLHPGLCAGGFSKTSGSRYSFLSARRLVQGVQGCLGGSMGGQGARGVQGVQGCLGGVGCSRGVREGWLKTRKNQKNAPELYG